MAFWKLFRSSRSKSTARPNRGKRSNLRRTTSLNSIEQLEARRVMATGLVADLNPGAASSFPHEIINLNGTAIFAANNGQTGVELFASDGSPGNITLLKDIYPGRDINNNPFDSNPYGFVEFDGYVYFAADDGEYGIELWRTDGTEQNTMRVKDIFQGVGSSNPADFVVVNGELYFTADDGIHGRELWKTNGKEGGTVLVADIHSGATGSDPTDLMVSNGRLYFAANDGVHGRELWIGDDPLYGTFMVLDINPGALSSNPTELTDVNGTVFFAAELNGFGVELWASRGSGGSTFLVRDIRAGTSSSAPTNLVNYNGVLYFSANDGVNGRELWASAGTSATTSMIADIRAGAGSSNPGNLTVVGNSILFKADDGLRGVELWKSDGTGAGTTIVKDIKPGAGSSNPTFLIDANGQLYMAADDGTNGIELWVSDGTNAGTTIVADINPNPGVGSAPAFLAVVNSRLVFRADDGTNGAELWYSDLPNQNPIVVASEYSYDPGVALVVGAPGVLTNAVDPEGAPLTATVVTTTTNGVLVLNADGSFTYTPNVGFRGEDSFTFTASDGMGGTSAVTTVKLVSRDVRWITNLYEELLDRNTAPTAGEINFWTQQLQAGATRAEIVARFQATQEYRTLIINELYQQVFKRNADAGALAYWSNLMGAGVPAIAIHSFLLSSNEYAQGDLVFVTRLYNDLLGRNASSAEVLGWRAAISAGVPRSTVAFLFLSSGEFSTRVVNELYQKYFDRDADAAELSFWKTEIANGRRWEQIEATLAASDAYYQS